MPGKRTVTIGLLVSFFVAAAAAFAAEAPRRLPRSQAQVRGEAPISRAQKESSYGSRYVEDEVLVRFQKGASPSRAALAHGAIGAASVKKLEMVDGLELVKLPRGLSVREAIGLYRENPDVLYAEPNYIVTAIVTPNDPSLINLWGLQNIGQAGGTIDADIDAPGAWDITTGSASVVVAVIDTGVDYNHADLSANIWSNADCNNNGIDDDGNGYVDDCHGIDTANNDTNPMDDHSHGTHVSGTIGAIGDNGLGVVGVNWDVSIMACKFLSAAGSGFISDAIDCLNYVAMMKDRGVNIVATSNSWSGGGFSQALYDAIDAHRQRVILFIAAAANATANNDSTPSYPANYYLPNLISVAATNRFDGLAYFSNYGRRTVHIGAPGQDILSTTPGNTYSTFSGTSMATPHVTGVAALLKAQDPSRDWRALKNLILAGGDNNSALTNTITQKRLNAYGALTCSSSTVLSRLRPVANTIAGFVGTPLDLAVLHINCASPNGDVAVTIEPGGGTVVLVDDGAGPGQAAGDGIYSAQWTPSTGGTFTLTFPGGDVVTVQVQQPLANYTFSPTSFNYRTIAGTNLNLVDDQVAQITPPFPILFGGGNFTQLHVVDNGVISFDGSFPSPSWFNTSIPNSSVPYLIAPFWEDLSAVSATAQNVWWAVLGAAPNRELVIEWRDLPQYSCVGTAVKFQVVLFEGKSDILFSYADTIFGSGCADPYQGSIPADQGGAATVGVQVASGVGTQFSFNSPSVGSGTALLWTLESSTPIINVTPATQDFGNVPVGGSADKSFTVKNLGGDILAGNAGTSSPFSIVSGGSYALGPGQSQITTIRFNPTSAGTYMGNAVFTGGGDASRLLTGAGVTTSTLTLTKTGAGDGTVASNPAGVSCGNDCSESYNYGTIVTLTPTPAGGALFGGWSGDPDCSDGVVTVNADKTCTATFVTPLALGSLLLPSGEAGVAYSAPLVTGGLGPYTFTIVTGVFPPVLTFNSSNGRLTGTPAPSKGGTFTVKITDQLGSSVTGTFKITILGALSISTKSLKAGTHGKAYKGALKATGGGTPKNWTVTGLPPGLALNSATGTLTGTPTQTGIFNLTFQVTDPLGGVAQKALTLTIN